MAPSSGILIYCERTGMWAASLRRQPGIAAIAQRETRSLVECREVLAEHPSSLVVLELRSENLERALEWLSGLPSEFPKSRSIVVADRSLVSHEWVVREFGCLTFTTSPRELPGVAQLVNRYFASLPAPEMTIEERVWAQLPWRSQPG